MNELDELLEPEDVEVVKEVLSREADDWLSEDEVVEDDGSVDDERQRQPEWRQAFGEPEDQPEPPIDRRVVRLM